ncbi:glycosyltransferase family 2 protein [Phanerochaete carnosa HHB-10118-sp]|uniref:Glycosyltransferase family 2 protein n=1 Tax=Phanerochaete carnosa (strain HHB-10118-sp) TaxID=650164 RepID=K5V9M4_PHACS|nr:glycosyltransferase family 2 protein [Phanerochaete carnosa HHB-10118-sp]EKM59541.1 glycosyltransferase family 2 protein [Phanerochaete carnosa HHB-10118-sp]
MPSFERKRILVTGGNGFIGSHVARGLISLGHFVKVADLTGRSLLQTSPDEIEVAVGDLRDRGFAYQVVRGADYVLHFAANMGGMGTIHNENEITIYRDNHTMLLNVLQATIDLGVEKFLFASSACVYPESLQRAGQDVSLAENNVWADPPPRPQGLYGLEKLCSELVILRGIPPSLKTYTVRFHNIYGPYGSWKDGREKVPAALLRKAVAAKISGDCDIELWGDGTQRRSFCYIDDAVEGVLKLLNSECHDPINIGSEEAVTIRRLAEMAAEAVGLQEPSIRSLEGMPLGVASRNSNNAFVRDQIRWEPQICLQEGLRRTGQWIEEEIRRLLPNIEDSKCANSLEVQNLKKSTLLHLRPRGVVFALLLPVTSRRGVGALTKDSSALPCLDSLQDFARTLIETTADDVSSGKFSYRIYLAIDEDDKPLLEGGNAAERALRKAGVTEITTLLCNYPRGRVCSLWRDCARRAWKEDCDYFVLMGDDVTLHTPGWMSKIHATFIEMEQETGTPLGLGCVAFEDATFPGMPTFPVVHRMHMEIFDGRVVPDVFVNQDGDPFLYQLYRRFGCSRSVGCEIRNAVGGGDDARYEKEHAKDWTLGALSEATAIVEKFLRNASSTAKPPRRLTVDVIIPCYRVMLPYLDVFLALQASPTCSVMFIIIVDDPNSPNIRELKAKYEHRLDVRIRINKKNLGASASRNRGLSESAAEWVLFLDDDVTPEQDILVQLEKCIRAHPNAAGFVGNAKFPLARTIFTTAVHLAGVTYFWDIASKMSDSEDVPWGVTANLAARRDVLDGVVYDVTFPKTGGGEDIDYCRSKREYSVSHGGTGFVAAPNVTVTHPYWNSGDRSYWRFYMWAKGDGALVKLYPQFVYLDVPNSAELLLLCFVFSLATLAARSWLPVLGSSWLTGLQATVSVFTANIVHDCYRHLWRDAERTKTIQTNTVGVRWVLAVLESSLIRMFSEYGRVVGLLGRGDWALLFHRFDWFAGVWGDGPKDEERRNNAQRLSLSLALFALFVAIL